MEGSSRERHHSSPNNHMKKDSEGQGTIRWPLERQWLMATTKQLPRGDACRGRAVSGWCHFPSTDEVTASLWELIINIASSISCGVCRQRNPSTSSSAWRVEFLCATRCWLKDLNCKHPSTFLVSTMSLSLHLSLSLSFRGVARWRSGKACPKRWNRGPGFTYSSLVSVDIATDTRLHRNCKWTSTNRQ